jgi:uncharacterized protein YfiM (DUF2279 family)
MEQVHHSPSLAARPATGVQSADVEQAFASVMGAGAGQPAGEGLQLREERSALDGLVRDLSSEIQRMRAQFGSLQAAAGRAESANHRQINILLTQIASLSRSMNLSQALNSPEYRRAVGTMQALHNMLADQRGVGDGSNAATGEALAGLRSQEGVVQAALAQILQQLSALQMRMGALGALI